MSFSKDRVYKNPLNPDQKLPSVTTVLNILNKPALMYWSVNCCCDYILQKHNHLTSLNDTINSARKAWRSVQREALEIGTEVHEKIHLYLTLNKEPKIENSAVLSAFIAFLEWKEKHKLEIIECEKKVYHENYAGTADLICMLNGKRTLIDFKSSKDIYNEYIYQVAAYASAYNYTCANKIESIGILRLDKETGIPEYKDVVEYWDVYFSAFIPLVNHWWKKQKIKKRGTKNGKF